jgi:uncharacterized membrane protein YfcA
VRAAALSDSDFAIATHDGSEGSLRPTLWQNVGHGRQAVRAGTTIMELVATGPFSPTSWLLAAGAVLLIGIAKSGFGGGVGILAVPMFVVALGPKVGLGAMLPLLIAADCLSVYHHWKTWDRHNLAILLPGTLAGLAAGTAVLAWMIGRNGPGEGSLDRAEALMRHAIGAVCVAYVLADQVRWHYARHWRWRANWLSGTIAGGLAGVFSTLAHAAGPVIAIYLLGQHLAKQPFIGTTVLYFLLVNLLKLGPYVVLDMIDGTTLRYGLWLVPLVPLGTWIGASLNRIMSERLFRGVIMVLVFLTGLRMLLVS